ncbi:hypothetical protein GLOIN_2v1763590 [Rhizophagus clarus]|uniref:Uncharacterized protein n=1 Tax=Rhizophagus clarus TaxID=94130 RepID=A0A8H3L8C2_9GLOM|nr:hypothetical protein GLOIN_2v1763590 [Rhizophagus clarus]
MQASFVKENEYEGTPCREESGENIMCRLIQWVISTTTYTLDTPSDHKVDVWVDIGHYGVPTYYVSKEVMESSNISDKLLMNFVNSCRNGEFSELLRRKWFVQGHQLSNHTEVIRAYNYVGKEQAERIEDSHHLPRDQFMIVGRNS